MANFAKLCLVVCAIGMSCMPSTGKSTPCCFANTSNDEYEWTANEKERTYKVTFTCDKGGAFFLNEKMYTTLDSGKPFTVELLQRSYTVKVIDTPNYVVYEAAMGITSRQDFYFHLIPKISLDSQDASEEKIYSFADQMPAPNFDMNTFLSISLRYPENARDADISGRVIVRFVVEKDGSVTHFQILKGPGFGLNDEAMRVVRLMPKWIPGKKNGEAVRTYFTLPISFKLS